VNEDGFAMPLLLLGQQNELTLSARSSKRREKEHNNNDRLFISLLF
jgi:hypothetical protein